MALRTTRWTPDTCGCQIDFAWDDAVPQDARQHTYAGSVASCPAHRRLHGREAHWQQVLQENTRKNLVHGIVSQHPALSVNVTDPVSQHSYPQLHWSVQMRWSYDAERHLTIALDGAKAEHKAEIQAQADAQLGPGAVTIA